MRVVYNFNAKYQDNVLNGELSVFNLVENIRNRGVNFDDREEAKKEHAYHLMTLKTDRMTIETAATYFNAITADPLSVELFARAITGDYRSKEFMAGSQRIMKSTDAIIAKSASDPEIRPNTPEENTELLNRLSKALGYSVLDYVMPETKEYLLTRCNPEKLVTDSKEPAKDERIRW